MALSSWYGWCPAGVGKTYHRVQGEADLRDENTNISFRSTLLGVGDA